MDMLAFPDHRVVARTDGWVVLAQRHEVMFRDGHAVHLHPIAHQALPQQPDPMLRALQVDGLRWLVVDLRKLSAEIEDDLRRLEPRDSFGVVWFTLHGAFATRSAFLAAVHQLHTAAWWAEPLQAAA